jgi:hypothetical protein
MRPHPAEYWIKFYISRRSHSASGISDLLLLHNLGGITADEITEIEQEMDFPDPFLPKNKNHVPSKSFLKSEGIYEAWNRNVHMKQAMEILSNNPVRHLVETYLLSPMKAYQAINTIKARTDFPISLKAYELYRHYFWNTDLLSGTDWGRFIGSRSASNSEWLNLALDTRNSTGIEALLWKTGAKAVQKIEANKIFTDIRNIGYMCIQQLAMKYPNKDHAMALLNYARVVRIGQDGMDSSNDSVQDVVEAFSAFKIRYKESNMKPIDQLTGGNYSEAESTTDEEEKIRDY